MTPPPTLNYFGQNVPVASVFSLEPGYVQRITDLFISNANAQGTSPLVGISASVTGTSASVLFTPSSPTVSSWSLFQSNLPTDGTQGTVDLGPGGQCPGGTMWPSPGIGPQGLRIVGYSFGDPTITIELEGGMATRSYTIPLAPGTASAVACA